MSTLIKLTKRGLLLLLLLGSLQWKSRAQAVSADPAVGSLDIVNLDNSPANANTLGDGNKYLLTLQIQNLSFSGQVPANSAEIRINLGTNMVIDPAFSLATAPLNSNFTWSYIPGVTPQIKGVIHTALPAFFFGTAQFRVKANIPGASIAIANFVVTNGALLSDVNSGNNNAFVFYTVVANAPPLAVTLTRFTAVKTDCAIKANWSVENEINFDHYELQISKDGLNFTTVGTVQAIQNADYSISYSLTGMQQANILQVRLKMVDRNGTFKYSNTVPVTGTCNSGSAGVYGYPNPVTRNLHAITIANRDGAFKGTYQLTLSDMNGKVYSVKEMLLNNVNLFQVDVGQLTAAGKYVIRMQKTDGSEISVIPFQKL